jgi:sulfur carrier protein ThiS
MLIVLNGQNCDVKSIVHKQARVETVLNEGDRLEVVAPIGGG